MSIHAAKVLVTGGAGFIGSHLCEALVERGAQVAVVDDLSSGRLENLVRVRDQIEFFEFDVGHVEFKRMLRTKDFDAIFYFSGIAYVPPSVNHPDRDFDTNLAAPFRFLENLRRLNPGTQLIMASSAAVYGNPVRNPISEEDPTRPISPYGVSKLAIERYVSVYSQLYGLKSASLRLFSVLGPRQHKQIVYDFIEKISANPDCLEVLGDGTQIRDLIYVEDAAQAALAVLEKAPMEGEVYNVATGLGNTTHAIGKMVFEAMGLVPSFRYSGKVRPGDPAIWIGNIEHLRKLGFEPKVSLAEGIRRTVEWYKEFEGHVERPEHAEEGV